MEVTTSLELPPELPTSTPIANWTGWVSRWGQWVVAKVIGWCEEGTRYRILYQTKCGQWDEALAFPSYMRWPLIQSPENLKSQVVDTD